MNPQTRTLHVPALVIGGGPAGLMAAETLAHGGVEAMVAEAKPSLGRKFLMAGKSGLNLTKSEPEARFLSAYGEAADWLAPMIAAFGPHEIKLWAEGLGASLFTGSTGRVFPREMKASPLLRAWIGYLGERGITLRTRWRWVGWDGSDPAFDTPEGAVRVRARATILALGGASWPRLGADGRWAKLLRDRGIDVAPFGAANAALSVDWSAHMARHFGSPVKNVAFRAGPYHSRGEAVISARGLEGGGIYSVSRGVREGQPITMDLLPNIDEAAVAVRLAKPRAKASLATHLRKQLGLTGARAALLREFAHPFPDAPQSLARTVKELNIRHAGLRPLEEAISVAGGVPARALTEALMLRQMPGVFCAGEMLDWEAPTGGYLLTGCLATGRCAGQGALNYLSVAGTASTGGSAHAP